MGVYNSHGRLRLGQQGFLISTWVRLPHTLTRSTQLGFNISSFLSVAWTMTDYDGTTQ
jgi:hypothetical protein